MHCSEFLELYSDYRDGLLTDSEVARSVRQHLRECDACMAYDTLVCRGVFALRATSDLEPSRRISIPSGAFTENNEPYSSVRTRIVGGLMVAAAITLLFWPRSENPHETPSDLSTVANQEQAPSQPAIAPPRSPAPPVSFVDSGVPAFRHDIPVSQQREVSFEAWVALPR